MITLPPRTICRRGFRGVALVSVLALLVLITALIVGFLVRVGTEGVASSNYTGTVNSRFLADTAVNIVQAQINEATITPVDSAWASQPGAIRVFDNQGNLTKIYRLYSSASLDPTASDGKVLQADVPPDTWGDSPSVWTDLNAPVKVQGMSDGAGARGADYLVFPILDPRDPANPAPDINKPDVTTKVPGFSVNNAKGATTQQPIPMPVRWLYVLEDGRIIAPTISGKTVTVSGATKQNPIVGRIAYWTDDECSKVNINTAAGSFGKLTLTTTTPEILPAAWDVPRYTTVVKGDVRFSDNQPAHGEYQRYPGHPATTDLYRIFSALNISLGGYPDTQTGAGTASGFFNLLPRYSDDYGSKGGTVNTTTAVPPNVGLKNNRLYTSLGELRYAPDRVVQPATAPVSRQQVESGKFFLTAHSRAPESTLFGTPRISMWPIPKDYGDKPDPSNTSNAASPFDKLIAFCSTIGNVKGTFSQYYFQRYDPTLGDYDYQSIPRNRSLYGYLQNLTSRPIPGFKGGSLQSKYSFPDEMNQILTEMVDYIRCTNLYDHSRKDPDPVTNKAYPRYTPKFSAAGSSQVVPLKIGNTRGLGRMYTLGELGVQVICTADGNSPLTYQAPLDFDGTNTTFVSPVKGSVNDAFYVSNLPSSQYLRDSSGTNGRIVGWDATNRKMLTSSSETTLPPGAGPFPANPTLTTSGTYNQNLQRLQTGEKMLQAMLLFELSSPMEGFDPMIPDFQIVVEDGDKLSIAGNKDLFPSSTTTSPVLNRLDYVNQTGGNNGIHYFISKRQWSDTDGNKQLDNLRVNGWSNPAAGSNGYNFVSKPFKVSSSSSMQFDGGKIKVKLQVKDKTTPTQWNTAQTFEVTFPSLVASVGTPDLIQEGNEQWNNTSKVWVKQSVPLEWWGFDTRIASILSVPSAVSGSGISHYLSKGCVIRNDSTNVTPGQPLAGWTPDRSSPVPVFLYKDTAGKSTPTVTVSGVAKPVASDFVRSLIPPGADTRLVMAKDTVRADGSADMVKPAGYDSDRKLAHNFSNPSATWVAGTDLAGKLVPGANYSPFWVPKVPSDLTPERYLDWDGGLPDSKDGAYANKPDEGNIYTTSGSHPYYVGEQTGSWTFFPSYFTANRIIPSPVMFGSLPTGVMQNKPWRTLLFRPPASNRPVLSGPPDHLLLDLFSMPVVEPYAISEPFSTAGKINMNYQIVPFTYINRSSGVQAVLGSELIARVPLDSAKAMPFSPNAYYKAGNVQPPAPAPAMARLPLNLSDINGTLRQFKERFDKWEIFKSASEICDIYLTPQGYNWTTDAAADTSWYGSDFAMVGDNVRERPYGNIYPRLTTKSNTFTVHYRVQSLKNPSATPAVWNEQRGVVTGEFRGSTTIERFIDPADPTIPDYATDPTAACLDKYYQWRVIANNAFAP